MVTGKVAVGAMALSCLSGAAFGQRSLELGESATNQSQAGSLATEINNDSNIAKLPSRFSGPLEKCLPPNYEGPVVEDLFFHKDRRNQLEGLFAGAIVGSLFAVCALSDPNNPKSIDRKGSTVATGAVLGATVGGAAIYSVIGFADGVQHGKIIRFNSTIADVIQTNSDVANSKDGTRGHHYEQVVTIPESNFTFRTFSIQESFVAGQPVVVFVRVDRNNRITAATLEPR